MLTNIRTIRRLLIKVLQELEELESKTSNKEILTGSINDVKKALREKFVTLLEYPEALQDNILGIAAREQDISSFMQRAQLLKVPSNVARELYTIYPLRRPTTDDKTGNSE